MKKNKQFWPSSLRTSLGKAKNPKGVLRIDLMSKFVVFATVTSTSASALSTTTTTTTTSAKSIQVRKRLTLIRLWQACHFEV